MRSIGIRTAGASLFLMMLTASVAEATEGVPTEIITRVCRVPMGDADKAISCDDPGVQMVFRENAIPDFDFGPNECVATFTVDGKNPCNLPEYRAAFNATVNLEVSLEAITSDDPALCCNNVGKPGSKFLDILIFDRELRAAFVGDFQVIAGGRDGSETLGNVDAIAHEFGHALVFATNRALYLKRDPSSDGLNEGLSDALQAAWAAGTSSAFGSGEPWVFGDGPSPTQPAGSMLSKPLGVKSDLRIPRFFDGAFTAEFERARSVYANYFYRLSTSGAFTSTELLAFVARVAKALADDNGNGIYDPSDLIAASNRVIAATGQDPQKLAAVARVSADMSRGSPPPSQPTAPPAPAPPLPPRSVRRTASLGCSFVSGVGNASIYRIAWDPSFSATSYNLFSRAPSGVWQFKASIPGPTVDVFTNFMTEFSVSACNANGCSAIALPGAFADNSLCGF